jgi:hypothetical protein
MIIGTQFAIDLLFDGLGDGIASACLDVAAPLAGAEGMGIDGNASATIARPPTDLARTIELAQECCYGIKKLLTFPHEKEDMTSFKYAHLRAGYAGMHLFR